jgi:hypothetical protein
LDLFLSSGERGKTSMQLGPLERANLNHLRMKTDPVSETLCLLVSIIPDDGQSPITQ